MGLACSDYSEPPPPQKKCHTPNVALHHYPARYMGQCYQFDVPLPVIGVVVVMRLPSSMLLAKSHRVKPPPPPRVIGVAVTISLPSSTPLLPNIVPNPQPNMQPNLLSGSQPSLRPESLFRWPLRVR